MNSLTRPSSDGSPRSRTLLTVQILLTTLTGVFTLLAWLNDIGPYWRLYAGLFAGSMTALIFRSGWLIPCTVCGTLFGIFIDPPIKSGPIDAQMWQTVSNLWSGVIAGLVMGVAIEITLKTSDDEHTSIEDSTYHNDGR